MPIIVLVDVGRVDNIFYTTHLPDLTVIGLTVLVDVVARHCVVGRYSHYCRRVIKTGGGERTKRPTINDWTRDLKEPIIPILYCLLLLHPYT